ncbi:MAG: YggT family protein, partial [Cyanobacteria bacterium J06648_11]
QIYFYLLIARVLLTWFPLDWSNPLLSALSQVTDPYLNLFRSLIPPLGGLDLSPMVAILALQFGSQFLFNALARAAYTLSML